MKNTLFMSLMTNFSFFLEGIVQPFFNTTGHLTLYFKADTTQMDNNIKNRPCLYEKMTYTIPNPI